MRLATVVCAELTTVYDHYYGRMSMNINHDKPAESSPLAGKTVKIKANAVDVGGNEYHVEDYWHLIAGKSWMFCDGNPACLDYAMRNIGLPTDNNVLYGKIGGAGKLVHISEIEGQEDV